MGASAAPYCLRKALHGAASCGHDYAMSDAAANTADIAPMLNGALDRASLAAAFAAKGRVHIPGVLTQDSARRLFLALKDETPWRLTLNKGDQFLDFPNLSQEERNRIAMGAWQRAQSQFQYLFDTHRLSMNGEPYPEPTHYFARLVAFLNSPQMLSLVREVTGFPSAEWADAQATLYKPGDFLTQHDDRKSLSGGYKRIAAYVLNMTPVWRADWGGILQFHDARGHIEEGFVPTFNALNMFRVPTVHSVSQVALFGGHRYSVTGWYHAKG
jgi:SM-20-related protein